MDYTLLAGPVVGALIGYITNKLAVKMLFRPLHPVKVMGKTLPFTPGIIPKSRERLASSLGRTIGGTLFTGEDLKKHLLSETVQALVVDRIYDRLLDACSSTINELADKNADELKDRLSEEITERIYISVTDMDLGKIVANLGSEAIKEKLNGSMLRLMINDALIDSFAEPIGHSINSYILENGREMISPCAKNNLDELFESTLGSILDKIELNPYSLKEQIKKVYQDFIGQSADSIAKSLDIPAVVEKKISAMDVLEIEEIILSIMNKELSAIVNLGALLGFIIGAINIFI